MVNRARLSKKSGILKKVSSYFRICCPVVSGFGVQFKTDLLSSLNRIWWPVEAGFYTILFKCSVSIKILVSER